MQPGHGGPWATQYLVLGFEHILPKGLDHILFVPGHLPVEPEMARPVRWHKTSSVHDRPFDHASLTIALRHRFSLSLAIVELLIALSITYVAIENLFTSTLKPWRIALVFVIGRRRDGASRACSTNWGLPRAGVLHGARHVQPWRRSGSARGDRARRSMRLAGMGRGEAERLSAVGRVVPASVLDRDLWCVVDRHRALGIGERGGGSG